MTDEDINAIKSEIAYKIYNSVVQRYPFAHSETENFLPARLADQILENWPEPNEFRTNLESSSVVGGSKSDKEHPYNFRYQICLSEENEINQISGKKVTFWKTLSEILSSTQVMRALVALYSNTLLRRFQLNNPNDLFTGMTYRARLHLLHDKTNYALGPHTDNTGKVVVVLIYFDSDQEDDTQGSFGTSVYIPKEQGFVCNTGIHHKREKFVRVYSAKFRKNNAFSFCRSDNSFHGVEKVQNKIVERKLLQYSLIGSPK